MKIKSTTNKIIMALLESQGSKTEIQIRQELGICSKSSYDSLRRLIKIGYVKNVDNKFELV